VYVTGGWSFLGGHVEREHSTAGETVREGEVIDYAGKHDKPPCSSTLIRHFSTKHNPQTKTYTKDIPGKTSASERLPQHGLPELGRFTEGT